MLPLEKKLDNKDDLSKNKIDIEEKFNRVEEYNNLLEVILNNFYENQLYSNKEYQRFLYGNRYFLMRSDVSMVLFSNYFKNKKSNNKDENLVLSSKFFLKNDFMNKFLKFFMLSFQQNDLWSKKRKEKFSEYIKQQIEINTYQEFFSFLKDFDEIFQKHYNIPYLLRFHDRKNDSLKKIRIWFYFL